MLEEDDVEGLSSDDEGKGDETPENLSVTKVDQAEKRPKKTNLQKEIRRRVKQVRKRRKKTKRIWMRFLQILKELK